MNFSNPNFNIKDIINNNVDSLNDISLYVDFAITSTIHKQVQDIDLDTEKQYAKNILNNFFKMNDNAFTSCYNIRNNMITIGRKEIKNMLIKNMIERDAFNKVVKKLLNATDYIDKLAKDISKTIADGRIDEINSWIDKNIELLIDNYVERKYLSDMEYRQDYESLVYDDYVTNRALEQLNLEMHIDVIKKR